jgi:hypothetical protein
MICAATPYGNGALLMVKEELMRRTHSLTVLVGMVLLVLLLTGCGTSKKQLEQQVTSSFQEKMNTDPAYNGYGLTVHSVTLVSSGGNNYDGIANLLYKSRAYDVPITVTSDGKTLIWQTKPGAFLFLLQ